MLGGKSLENYFKAALYGKKLRYNEINNIQLKFFELANLIRLRGNIE